jgi:hypothetical protein
MPSSPLCEVRVQTPVVAQQQGVQQMQMLAMAQQHVAAE